ncbi:MAG: tRNA (adenosine(37)-N6)-dimethylallyltransferase MiaA [Acutalibacteraceae bacterium]|nr:tRNA (adenosine(37)-N6)-dimethylallyltransferase MiaA [Acutalibacteraceae bacterium]
MNKPLVVVVVGPTASGKTSLSIDLAKKLNGEIVSADSMQIYRNMDIATAKPTEAEMQGIPHHLIGFLPMGESFSVADYKNYAVASINEILKKGKTPIVVGGTGLYIDTLINNTEFFDYEKSDIREKLEKKAEEEGIEQLYSELEKIDPETASKLHMNDTKRIIRALEVYYSTGKTITVQREMSHLNESEFDWCIIGLNAEDRQFLYDRINKRVDIMVESGLLQEAESFFASESSKTAKQAIGYKELKPYFDGFVSLEEALEKLKMETRRYSKRQLTWFRKNKKINWLYIDKVQDEPLVDLALNIINEHRS